jgi:hypothetical protein
MEYQCIHIHETPIRTLSNTDPGNGKWMYKREGKRPLGRMRDGLGDNIRTHLTETGWEIVDLDTCGSG